MLETSLHDRIVFATDVNQINSPAFYDCVVHVLCLRGRVVFHYNGQQFEMNGGEIAVISHPAMVAIDSVSNDFECEFIAAPDRFLHNLLPANNYSIQGGVSLFSNPIICVSEEDAEKFRSDLHNISRRIGDRDHRFYGEMIGGLLQTMIYDLFDFHTRSNSNVLTTDRVGYITSQFFEMLEAGRPKTEREVSHYARALNVTPKYLSDTIKRVTGHSISWHINKSAVLIIIEYLKDNKLSITQIADEMKFTSVSYFSRYCTKHLGMSPARFRLAGVSS